MKNIAISFSLLLCLSSISAYSQQGRGQQVENQVNFAGGLNTAYPSNTLDPTEAQDALNVFFDNGSLEKRGGSRKQNNTAIGGGSADVNNVFEYKKSNGTDYCVGFSSTNGYYSTDKCATFTSFISTLTAGEDINCVPFIDRLYCTNGTDGPFYFYGSSYTLVSDMPAGKYIRAYHNRLWVAGYSGQKSYVYFSGVGDGDSWDTTFNWLGFNPEDGDVITGIGEPIFEVLPVYKQYSSWAVNGNSSDNYTPVIVNSVIGASHHRTIKNFLLKNTKTIQLFSSGGIKGSEPGIYSFNGIVIQYLSDKIKDELANLDTFNAAHRYIEWDSGSEFAGGSMVEIDTYTEVGIISPSLFTQTDTTGADFSSGTLVDLSTNNITNTISLLVSYSSTTIFDNFSTGPNSSWTTIYDNGYGTLTSAGYIRVYGATVAGAEKTLVAPNLFYPDTIAYGKWSSDMYFSATNIQQIFFDFVRQGAEINSNRYSIRVRPYMIAPSHGTIIQFECNGVLVDYESTAVLTANTYYTFSVSRTTSNVFTVYQDDVVAFSTNPTGNSNFVDLQSSSYLGLGVFGVGLYGAEVRIDNVRNQNHVSSGTLTSQIFNTTFSTPTGGPFDVTYSTTNGETIYYYVRESTKNVAYADESGVWSAWSASSDNVRVPLTKQYWQYKAEFSTDYSTQTPVLYDVTLQANSTGYWTSPETQLDSGISTWGLVQSNEVTGGAGSWSYEIRASSYSGGTAAESWTSVTNNTTPSISTGIYVQIRATDFVGSTTDTAKIDTLTINYNVGSTAKSAVAEIYKSRYYWFAQSQNGTYNDIAYVLDSNGAWTKLSGINARSATLIAGKLYTGGSKTTAGGYIWRQDTSYADEGETINAYWQSKDYMFGSDDYLKAVDRIYITFPNSNTTLTTSLYGDGSLANTWTTTLDTDYNFGVKSMAGMTTSGITRAKYFNVKFANDSIYNWKLQGYRMYWTPLQVLEP